MDTITFWGTPVLLVPGVGLLILSTAAAFGRLHDEFHRLEESGSKEAMRKLLARAKLVRSALVALYASISTLAVSSLAGTVIHAYFNAASWLPEGLTAVGILLLTFASLQLVRESMHLYEVFKVE